VGRGTPRGCWRRRGRHGDCRCRGGTGGGSDEISATFGSPTALTGDDGEVGRRCGTSGEQSCRWLRLTTRSARVWGVGGVYGTVNLVNQCRRPPPPFMCAGRRGPTSHMGWAPPIRARLCGQGPTRIRWGPGRAGDQTNNLPLDLTLYFHFSLHLLFSHFIIDLCIEHASSSQSNVDRLNSYNTRLHSETDSLILLGPFSSEIAGCLLNPCRLRVP
jgi:hypothetical protein